MLMFNNYPLAGGAIHVAYSTSATAKARQQALRQARKTTFAATGSTGGIGGGGNVNPTKAAAVGRTTSNTARFWSENGSPMPGSLSGIGSRGNGGGGSVPGTPGAAAAARLRSSLDDMLQNPAGLGLDGIADASPLRHSFDHPGYPAPGAAGDPNTPRGLRRSMDSAGSRSESMRRAAAAAAAAAAAGGLPPDQAAAAAAAAAARVQDLGAAGFGGAWGGMAVEGAGLPAGLPLHASRQVYVSGLPTDLQEENLHTLFSVVAPVEHVRKPRNKVRDAAHWWTLSTKLLKSRSDKLCMYSLYAHRCGHCGFK